jgi:hypothetical protein
MTQLEAQIGHVAASLTPVHATLVSAIVAALVALTIVHLQNKLTAWRDYRLRELATLEGIVQKMSEKCDHWQSRYDSCVEDGALVRSAEIDDESIGKVLEQLRSETWQLEVRCDPDLFQKLWWSIRSAKDRTLSFADIAVFYDTAASVAIELILEHRKRLGVDGAHLPVHRRIGFRVDPRRKLDWQGLE